MFQTSYHELGKDDDSRATHSCAAVDQHWVDVLRVTDGVRVSPHRLDLLEVRWRRIHRKKKWQIIFKIFHNKSIIDWIIKSRLVPLTEEAFKVLWTAVVRPVRVLQVPDCPLLVLGDVFDLQPCGGVAARFRPEARGDPESAVSHRVVPGAKTRPIAATLLSTALLQEGRDVGNWRCSRRSSSGNHIRPHPLPLFKKNLLDLCPVT